MKTLKQLAWIATLAGTLGLAGELRTAYAQQPQPQTVAPEKNPPGDIPDTQVFVPYSSTTGGYKLEVPEGWARQINGNSVSFRPLMAV